MCYLTIISPSGLFIFRKFYDPRYILNHDVTIKLHYNKGAIMVEYLIPICIGAMGALIIATVRLVKTMDKKIKIQDEMLVCQAKMLENKQKLEDIYHEKYLESALNNCMNILKREDYELKAKIFQNKNLGYKQRKMDEILSIMNDQDLDDNGKINDLNKAINAIC